MSKTKKVIFLIFLFLFLFATTNFFIPVVAASNSVDYSFENETYFNDDLKDALVNELNVRNKTAMTGVFNATYRFDNDIGLEGHDISFVDTYDATNSIPKVIQQLDGHFGVLEMEDGNLGGDNYQRVLNAFESAHASGTLEFQFYSLSLGLHYILEGYSTSNGMFVIGFNAGNIFYFDHNGNSITLTSFSVEKWYHFKISFDANAIIPVNITINGQFFNADKRDITDTGLTSITFRSHSNDFYYIDAVGYSWDSNYEVGMNFFPYMESVYSQLIPTSYTVDHGLNNSGNLQSFSLMDGDYFNITSTDHSYCQISANFSDFIGLSAFLNLYAIGNVTGDMDWYLASEDINGHFVETIYNEEDTSEILNVVELEFTFQGRLEFLIDSDTSNTQALIDVFTLGILQLNRSQTDKIEFIANSTGSLYAIGSNDIENWDIVESGGNIEIAKDDGIDKMLNFTVDSSDGSSFARKNLNINEFDVNDFIETEVKLYLGGLGNNFKEQYFLINYTDINDNLLFSFCVQVNYFGVYVLYYNTTQVGENWKAYDPNDVYECLWGNYQYDTAIFYFKMNFYNNVLNMTFETNRPAYYVSGYTSLMLPINAVPYNITFIHEYADLTDVDDTAIFSLDYLSYYINGSSFYSEVAPYNVYSLFGDVTPSYTFIEMTFDYSSVGNNVSILVNDQYQLINYGDLFYDGLFYCLYPNVYNGMYLVIENSTSYEINNVLVYSIIMKNKVTNDVYDLELEYGGVDLNESYFYVSGESLYYTITFNDENVEYLSAMFDCPTFGLTDYYIRFDSLRSGLSFGYFSLVCYSGITFSYSFDTTGSTKGFELGSGRYLDEFNVLITDNNLSSISTCSGYIDTISFEYIPDISISLTTLSLLEAIIPLIVILAPTLGLGVYLQKKGQKRFVIPLFFLMSLIMFIGLTLPLWMFVIISIGVGVLVFLPDDRGGNESGSI